MDDGLRNPRSSRAFGSQSSVSYVSIRPPKSLRWDWSDISPRSNAGSSLEEIMRRSSSYEDSSEGFDFQPSPATIKAPSLIFPESVHEMVEEAPPCFWDRITFGHFNRFMWKCFRSKVSPEDMLPMRAGLQAEYCWNASNVGHPINSESTSVETTQDGSDKFDGSLSKRLFCSFWKSIVLVMVLEVFLAAILITPIFITRGLIDSILRKDTTWGYTYCGLFAICGLAKTVVMNQIVYLSAIGGAQMRAALITIVYNKVLMASSESREDFLAGDILNMVSVDVENVYGLATQWRFLMNMPFRMVIYVGLVGWMIGPGWMACALVLIVVIPISITGCYFAEKYFKMYMTAKDKRLESINEILSGLKIIKMYAWEGAFMEKVNKLRKEEMRFLKRAIGAEGLSILIWNSSPFLFAAGAFGTFVLWSPENILSPDVAFSCLLLFSSFGVSLVYIPMVISKAIMAKVALKRISSFLRCDELVNPDDLHEIEEGKAVEIKDASFSWGSGSPTLTDISFSVKVGQCVAIIGRVGSGKSSLLSAILGEMNRRSGSVHVREGDVAYLPQQAWIQNDTIRQNIVFAQPFDRQWYTHVLTKCCLGPDLKQFAAGDMTGIGEMGVNLSGGQKQRLSLARAVYQKAEMYLMDDTLSALDANVSHCVFRDIISSQGLLKDTTRIISTHSTAILPYVDRIFIVDKGRITHSGTHAELVKLNLSDFVGGSEEEKDDRVPPESKESWPCVMSGINLLSKPASGAFGPEEAVETGQVKWSVYWTILKNFGIVLAIISFLGYCTFRGAYIYSGYWLREWSEASGNITKKTTTAYTSADSHGFSGTTVASTPALNGTTWAQSRSLAWHYLGVYIAMGGGGSFAVMIGALCLACGCLSASFKLHSDMLWALLRAPVRFFDVTPFGRIVNRFNQDVNALDVQLYLMLDDYLELALAMLATMIMVSTEIPLILVAVIPTGVLFGFLQRVYASAVRQMKRLTLVSLSPVLNHFSETMNGASSIRAYRVQNLFRQKNFNRVDVSQSCLYHHITVNGWSTVRFDFVTTLLATATCAVVVYYGEKLGPAVSGMLIAYTLVIVRFINRLTNAATEMESTIVAGERVIEYTKIKGEAPWESHKPPPKSWPSKGKISIVNYSAGYGDGAQLALKNLCLEISAGEKVGVVGRTGAGKSSLTLAIFRIIEPTEGKIVIDDIDHASIGLHDLRSRLTMIPQDPVLFRGTMRANLDPNEDYTDEQVRAAAEASYLSNLDLSNEVIEGGSNLSVGERQLVCLARALLRKSKILVLDEATAAVDHVTDALIQGAIRKDFADSTIITIAHRLNTVLDYDTIVVLASGEIVEKGSPRELLKDQHSIFYSMAKDSHIV